MHGSFFTERDVETFRSSPRHEKDMQRRRTHQRLPRQTLRAEKPSTQQYEEHRNIPYYDGSREGDEEIVCVSRCSLDVRWRKRDSDDETKGNAWTGRLRKRKRNSRQHLLPVVMYVHGGSWRVGHRRAWLFSGRHERLSESYHVAMVSVGYRRSRMAWWVFYGIYPLVVFFLFLGMFSPLLLSKFWSTPSYLNLEVPYESETIVAMFAAFGASAYYLFWGLYPTHGSNFSSQCERGGGVTYRECAIDVARAVRWVVDHASEYDFDVDRIYLVGHSAGAHLVSLVATDRTFLKRMDLSTQVIAGVAALAGPYSVETLLREVSIPFRYVVWFMIVRSAFGTDRTKWDVGNPSTHLSRDQNDEKMRRRGQVWVVLHGEHDMPMFEVQMNELVRALKTYRPRFRVQSAVVRGKGHGTMVRTRFCSRLCARRFSLSLIHVRMPAQQIFRSHTSATTEPGKTRCRRYLCPRLVLQRGKGTKGLRWL